MTTRRPLKDLPLEQFLLPNATLPTESSTFSTHTPFKSVKKRPLDPNPPPAKRRILSFDTHTSPARKLDFAKISDNRSHADHKTPTRLPRASVNLHPSPDLPPKRPTTTPTISLNDHGLEIDHCFSDPPLPQLPLNRRSVHYPGFDIHRDLHRPSVQLPPPVHSQVEKDEYKENIPPRRKSRKAISGPPHSMPDKSLLSPCVKSISTPTTPKKSRTLGVGPSREGHGTPTPRRKMRSEDSADLTRVMMSSPWMSATREEKREGKKRMEVEVDGDEDDDGEI